MQEDGPSHFFSNMFVAVFIYLSSSTLTEFQIRHVLCWMSFVGGNEEEDSFF